MALRRLPQRNLDSSGMRLSSGYGQVVSSGFEGSSWQVHDILLQPVVRRSCSITFFISVCAAAAAWPVATDYLTMFEYFFFAAAGFAAFEVLYRVFFCVCAIAARLSALVGVFVQFGRSGVCSAKVKSVWLLFGVLPGVAFGNAPSPSICEWDASCQSVPGFGYPTLGFLFFAAAALIVIAMIILLLKCCSLCSGSCEEWKKESSLKLVDEKWFPYFSLQVVSWFTVVVMESWSGGWAALLHNVVAYLSVPVDSMFGAGGVMDLCRQTSLCFHRAMFAIISSMGFTLLCGHVLGLRQPHVAAAYFGAFVGLLALVGVLSYAFEGLGVRQGSRFAFEQAKATPRVDVAETPQASPFLEAQGKTFIQSGPSLVSSRSLLVRALTGRTLVVRWSSSEDVFPLCFVPHGCPSSCLLPHA